MEGPDSLTNLHQFNDNKRLLQSHSAASQQGGEGPFQGLDQEQTDTPGQPATVHIGSKLGLLLDLSTSDTS